MCSTKVAHTHTDTYIQTHVYDTKDASPDALRCIFFHSEIDIYKHFKKQSKLSDLRTNKIIAIEDYF